jgi:hypothetical protein
MESVIESVVREVMLRMRGNGGSFGLSAAGEVKSSVVGKPKNVELRVVGDESDDDADSVDSDMMGVEVPHL